MKSRQILLLWLGALLVAAATVHAEFTQQVQVLPRMLRWERPFGPQGPERADVSGDKVRGPYSFFLKLPPGFDSGWHTHDATYTALVLSGVVMNLEQGDQNLPALPAQSVWTQPGKRNHVTRCVSQVECLIYVMSSGGATFHPHTAEGRPLGPTAHP